MMVGTRRQVQSRTVIWGMVVEAAEADPEAVEMSRVVESRSRLRAWANEGRMTT